MKKIAIITLVLGLITIGIGFYAGGLVSEASAVKGCWHGYTL